MPLNRFLSIACVAWKIGIWNVIRVLRYRLALRFKTLRFEARGTSSEEGVFFAPLQSSSTPKLIVQTVFGWKDVVFNSPPDWHCSVLSRDRRVDREKPWSEALASVPSNVDVKEIWELSRFYWVPQLAQEVLGGNADAGATLNLWLRDWEANNPPYQGINWSCGQEAAIRILHCAQAAILLKEVDRPQAALVRLLANSAARIAPTLHYALGQANNHGSTEAAGLFVAGTWLARLGADSRASYWKKLGRRWLENRATTLILEDGSSNQYSTNYHRIVLDTYCFAEAWRRLLGEPGFSSELTSRMRKASRWLFEMTDEATGLAPAFGANDGSLLLSQGPRNYRDFRPSVQLGAVLFENSLAYSSEHFDELLRLYELERPASRLPVQMSQNFERGGYLILRQKCAAAIMRYPNYKYRPSHADALHLDFYANGKQILFDGGTYSYAVSGGDDLSGGSSHNTIEFDGFDQMDRISRFLYGSWLKASSVHSPAISGDFEWCSAEFEDSRGHRHRRKLIFGDRILIIKDFIDGFDDGAVMRWRMPYSEFLLENNKAYMDGFSIEFGPYENLSDVNIFKSLYAPYYLKKDKCLVAEIKIPSRGEITTVVKF